MAKVYDIKDKSERLALCYGHLPIGYPNAKLIYHETLAVGSEIQVTFRQALGAGPFDGVDVLGYNGAIISSGNYIFHSGAEDDAPDAYFPDKPAAPGAAHISVRPPLGIASENDPTQLVGNFRCLKVAHYDSSGTQIGFSFNANPARVAMDIIKRTRPRILNRINWASWVAWHEFCATPVDVVVNGITVQIPRFEANIYVPAPFALKNIIDWICQISCTDLQWTAGRISFMPPVDRDPVFTFDLTQVSPDDYKFVPADKKNRPNMVVVNYKNLLDPWYQDATFELRRDALIADDGGVEKPLVINIGVAHPSQAERTAHYWARVRCDIPEYSVFLGGFMSYKVLPSDLVLFTHDVPDYEDKQFKIVEKDEDEDGGAGYPYKLTPYPSNAYSDTDHAPWTQNGNPTAPSRFAAPPAITSLTFEQNPVDLDEGTVNVRVFGTVTFGTFGYPQIGKVYWKPPGGSYAFIGDTRPDSNNQSFFEKENLIAGTHKFQVVTLSEVGRVQTASIIEYEIIVLAKTAAPGNVTSLLATLDDSLVKWTWTLPTNKDLRGVNLYRNGVFFKFLNTSEYKEAPAPDLQLTVKAVNTSGIEASGVSLTYSLPYPLNPAGFGLSFDGRKLIYKLNPVSGVVYEFARNNDGTNVLVENNTDGYFEESGFSTASRTLNRYARAMRFALYSSYVSASITVNAPATPVLTKEAGGQSPFLVKIQISPGESHVLETIIERRKAGDAWASSTAAGTPNVTRIPFAPTVADLAGEAGQTWEIRVKRVDLFGETSWSNTITHDFPLLSTQIDTNSVMYQRAGTNEPIRAGGGTFTITSGGLISWDAAMTVIGLHANLATSGSITIPVSTGETLADGNILVFRWNTPAHASPNQGALQVFTTSSYVYPTVESNQIDFEIARRAGSYVRLYDGRITGLGLTLDANTYIPRLAAGTAFIGSATIAWANITELQNGSYVADTNGFKWNDLIFEMNLPIRSLGQDIAAGAFRGLGGLTPTKLYRGTDSDIVPNDRIVASVFPFIDVNSADFVSFRINGSVTGKESGDAASNAETIDAVEVAVLNKFGEQITVFVEDFKGYANCRMVESRYPRKDADPIIEAYFKIRVHNRYNWSQPIYLLGSTDNPLYSGSGALYKTTAPTLKLRSNCPKLSVSPLAPNSTRISYEFGAGVEVWRRKIGGSWGGVYANIPSNPWDDTVELSPNTEFEYQLRAYGAATNRSNIIRVKTLQQGIVAPDYPEPVGLAGGQDGTTPQTKLNFTATAKGNVATQVYIDGSLDQTVSAVAVDATLSFSKTGLSAGQTINVKIRHDYGSGHYSDFTPEQSFTTQSAAVDDPPSIDSTSYSVALQQATINFTPHDSVGSGLFTLKVDTDPGGAFSTVISSSIAAGATSHPYSLAQTGSNQHLYYRLSRAGITGYGTGDLIIPAVDSDQSPINLTADSPDGLIPVNLEWENRGAAGTNVIQRRRGTSGSWLQVATALAGASTAVDEEVVTQGVHYYRIYNTAIPGVYSYSNGLFLDN